jgi:hypothetical protein
LLWMISRSFSLPVIRGRLSYASSGLNLSNP